MDSKTIEWRTAAHEVIKDVATKNSIIVSDMVVTALEAAGLGLKNYSALGGVFTRAAKDGFISKTDEKQHSTRGKSHSAKTVWISEIYEQDVIAPEARALNKLLMAALEFNAATVRYASLVYRATGLDPKNHTKAVSDFQAMQDTYTKQVAKIVSEYQTVGGQAK